MADSKNYKRPCPYCSKEVRVNLLCKHFLGACKMKFVQSCKKQLSQKGNHYLDISLKDGSLYCNLASKMSWSRDTLAQQYSIKNLEMVKQHRKICAELLDWNENIQKSLNDTETVESSETVKQKDEEVIVDNKQYQDVSGAFLHMLARTMRLNEIAEKENRKHEKMLQKLKEYVGDVIYEDMERSLSDDSDEEESVLPYYPAKVKKVIPHLTSEYVKQFY